MLMLLSLLFDRFGFIPKTFVLPGDMKALKAAFDKEGVKKKWIVKPPASARGAGIQVGLNSVNGVLLLVFEPYSK